MTEQYTPTTEEVRDTYEWGVHACGCCATPDEESLAEFDRWKERNDAEVAAKAYERAILDVGLNPDLANQLLDTNPYRKAVQS